MSVSTVFSKRYRDHWTKDVVLQLGRYTWTRQTMVDDLHNGHFNAAARLTKILRRLGIETVPQIRRIGVLDWARLEGVGEASLKILVDLLIYNGDSERLVEAWLARPYNGNLRQWAAICARAAKQAKRRGAHAA